jgi:hypothetical protein
MTEAHDKKIHAAGQREMTYLGICLSCEEEKIRRMLQRSRQISYAAARRSIGPAVLDAWASSFESMVGPYWRGLQLKENPGVSFYRSRYDVLPCVYIVHDRVRHIFIGTRW